MIFDYLASSWSFFFRWPVANAKVFRPVAVFLGPCLQTLIFLFFCLLSSFFLGSDQQPWIPFMGWIGLSMSTGFFHEDGLADTADSLGVSKFGTQESLEKIHFTFKDPRLGTFGVSALIIFWVFRYSLFANGAVSVVPAACICLFSRTFSLGLGLYLYPRVQVASSARSSHIIQQVSGRGGFAILFLSLLIGMLFCILSAKFFYAFVYPPASGFFSIPDLARVLLAIVIAFVLSGLVLHRLVRRTEALNGDLLGATVCFSEVFLTICFLRFF